uniref:Translation initiation factor eIF2B subunit gamma n=1 Tax=Panagrolaimus davidi TaxID=227884 RepID=A0A914PB67_9BILA
MTVFTEFQAVVFAGGYGNKMTDVTNNIPKPLLPVANVPLFWYALNTLHRNYIYDIILITNEKCDEKVREFLKNDDLPPLPGLNIEIVNPGPENDDWGTVEALRFVADRIKHDFILFSGDIVSDINLHEMLQQHRAEDSTMTVCLTENAIVSGSAPGPVVKKPPKYRDFSILPADSNRLLFLAPEDDFEEMKPKHQLFVKYQNVHLTARYSNCHIYIMKHGLLNVIKSLDDNFSSITAEFIPYILELQYGKRDKSIMRMIFGETDLHDEEVHGDYEHHHQHDKETSSSQNHDQEVQCFAYKATIDAVQTMARCNTIGTWFEANKSVLLTPKNFFTAEGINIAGLSNDRKLPGVDGRSAVDEEAQIGTNVKIVGSVIMKGAKIGNGAQIFNSVICQRVIIGEKCHIGASIIGNDQSIPDGTRLTNSVLQNEGEMDMDESFN